MYFITRFSKKSTIAQKKMRCLKNKRLFFVQFTFRCLAKLEHELFDDSNSIVTSFKFTI